MTRRVEALELGQLGEEQREAGQHGPGHQGRGQAGISSGPPGRAGAGRLEPGGTARQATWRGGQATAGVVEKGPDLLGVAETPDAVERERGPGQERRPGEAGGLVSGPAEAGAQPLLATDTACSSARTAAPVPRAGIVMRYGEAVVQLQRVDQAAGL